MVVAISGKNMIGSLFPSSSVRGMVLTVRVAVKVVHS